MNGNLPGLLSKVQLLEEKSPEVKRLSENVSRRFGTSTKMTNEEGDETEIGTDSDPERRQRSIDESKREINDSDGESESTNSHTQVSFRSFSRAMRDVTYTPTIQRLIARLGRPYNPF